MRQGRPGPMRGRMTEAGGDMPRILSKLRVAVIGAGLLAIAGCAAPDDVLAPPVPLGDFSLGYNIVVTKNASAIGPSRKATPEEWEAVLKDEIGRRFGRYEGDKLYHLGVNLDGYALAVPGIPVLLAPKSAVVVSVNVWDDASQKKLNAEPKQLTVLESLSGETIVGTGLTRSRDEQMRALAFNAAKAIERWLVDNRAEWFGETAVAPAKSREAESGN